jgi:large subunit ribosomal protein L23
MINTNVIIKPLVTEKSTHQQQTRNSYAFQVHRNANKPEIKKAVEAIYNVKVLEVRTMTRKGKPRRTKFKMTHGSDWKRAVVVLDENSRIELF